MSQRDLVDNHDEVAVYCMRTLIAGNLNAAAEGMGDCSNL